MGGASQLELGVGWGRYAIVARVSLPTRLDARL